MSTLVEELVRAAAIAKNAGMFISGPEAHSIKRFAVELEARAERVREWERFYEHSGKVEFLAIFQWLCGPLDGAATAVVGAPEPAKHVTCSCQFGHDCRWPCPVHYPNGCSGVGHDPVRSPAGTPGEGRDGK